MVVIYGFYGFYLWFLWLSFMVLYFRLGFFMVVIYGFYVFLWLIQYSSHLLLTVQTGDSVSLLNVRCRGLKMSLRPSLQIV